MNDVLKQELTGRPPVLVSLGGKEYPLAFSMFPIILYRQETAKLNRDRGVGRPKLTPAEIREARQRHVAIEAEAREKSDNPQEFVQLMQEATLAKLPLDEAAGSGDSLCLMHYWYRITTDDPEKLLLALWCGLHQRQPDETWKVPFTLAQLQDEKLINMGNAGSFVAPITEALLAYIKRDQEEPVPNVPAPEGTPPAQPIATKIENLVPSPNSGLSPVLT
jgi:hypothetical protein